MGVYREQRTIIVITCHNTFCVTGVIDKICRGVARNFYILRQEIGLGFVNFVTILVQEVHHLGGSGGM